LWFHGRILLFECFVCVGHPPLLTISLFGLCTRYGPSLADVAVLEAIRGRPDSEKYPSLARWYRTITSYSDVEVAGFGGSKDGVVVVTTSREVTTPAVTTDAPADDDDFDPFADDDEDEEAYRLQQERAEAALKAKEERDKAKAAAGKIVVAKSSILFDVKPWDDETDLAAMEAGVRSISMDGLTWGASKLIPVGFGIKKLQIMATIIDDLVPSTEEVEDRICAIEDHVQSVDIAAFNKL